MRSFFRLPYNWRTPFGYLSTMTLQIFITFLIISITFSALAFAIGFCVFLSALCSDLENDLHQLNENIRAHVALRKHLKKANSIKIELKICEIIRFHCDAKQLSRMRISWNFSFLCYSNEIFISDVHSNVQLPMTQSSQYLSSNRWFIAALFFWKPFRWVICLQYWYFVKI